MATLEDLESKIRGASYENKSLDVAREDLDRHGRWHSLKRAWEVQLSDGTTSWVQDYSDSTGYVRFDVVLPKRPKRKPLPALEILTTPEEKFRGL